jgi:hypothetical protein
VISFTNFEAVTLDWTVLWFPVRMRRFGAATQVGEAGTLRTESSGEKPDFEMEPE